MGRAAAAGEGDHKIGLAFPQHPFVADQGGVTPLALPIGRVHDQFNAPGLGPLARDAVNAARVALDYRIEPIVSIEPVKLSVDKRRISELSAAAY